MEDHEPMCSDLHAGPTACVGVCGSEAKDISSLGTQILGVTRRQGFHSCSFGIGVIYSAFPLNMLTWATFFQAVI